MTRKRSKSKGALLDDLDGASGQAAGASLEDVGLGSLDALPNETLLIILAKLTFPSRQYASLVCRRWRGLLLEPPFCRHVAPGQSLSEALQACGPGDTLICPPGMYQETLLVDKPVRLVAEDHWRAEQRSHRRRRSRGSGLAVQEPHHHHQQAAQHHRLGAAAAAATGTAAVVDREGPGPGPSGASPGTDHRLRAGGGGRQRCRSGGGGAAAAAAAGVGPGTLVPSVTVLCLRPPVVVMDSRCCFVGFEFHTTVAHNEVSICCFGPNSPLARFERCTFSGLTGLRVPYSKDSQTRLELMDCTLIGTTQSLAAVQMDAGRVLLVRCAVQNNAVGVEVGPAALARLVEVEVRWCGTALVVDGCLAMAGCRLWGNGKVGNVSTDDRLRAAMGLSEAHLAAGGAAGLAPPQAERQQTVAQQQQPGHNATGSPQRPPRAAISVVPAAADLGAAVSPPSNRNRGRSRRGGGAGMAAASIGPGGDVQAAAAANGYAGPSAAPTGPSAAGMAVTAGGGGSTGPGRVAALAAAQWSEVEAAFREQRQLVRVVGCEVVAPQLIVRAGLHKDVRKKARELVRQVYGAPDDDLFPEWEVLVQSDLDSEADEEDSSVSGGDMAAEEDEEEEEDPLDAADDPDLDESGSGGSSHSGSDSDSDGSGSGSASDGGFGSSFGSGSGDTASGEGEGLGIDEDGDADGGVEGGGEEEDDEFGPGSPMTSGDNSSTSGSDSEGDSSSDVESSDVGGDGSGDGDSDGAGSSGPGDMEEGDD